MGIPLIERITCARCGRAQDFVIWGSLNTVRNPVEVKLLLEGKLTLFTCPECGQSHEIVHPMLYHDMEQKFMIQVFPPKDGTNERRSMPAAPELEADYKTRVVDSFFQLREKALIFRCELDDRVIELVKITIRVRCNEQYPGVQTEVFLHGVTPENGATLHWMIRTPDGPKAMSFPRTVVYDPAIQKNAERLAAQPAPWSRVDEEFAYYYFGGTPRTQPQPTRKKSWWPFSRKRM